MGEQRWRTSDLVKMIDWTSTHKLWLFLRSPFQLSPAAKLSHKFHKHGNSRGVVCTHTHARARCRRNGTKPPPLFSVRFGMSPRRRHVDAKGPHPSRNQGPPTHITLLQNPCALTRDPCFLERLQRETTAHIASAGPMMLGCGSREQWHPGLLPFARPKLLDSEERTSRTPRSYVMLGVRWVNISQSDCHYERTAGLVTE